MDSYIHAIEDELPINALQSQLQQANLLINENDVLRVYSSNFESKLVNRCGRLGVAYKFTNHFSGYIGAKANWIRSHDKTLFNLYIQRTTTNERWLFADYISTTHGVISNSLIDSLIVSIQKYQNAGNSEGNGVALLFSPVVGLDYNNNNLNIGVKYEKKTSVHTEKANLTFPNDLSVGATYSLFHNKLDISVGADFKWDFYSDANSMIYVDDDFGNMPYYNITVGADYRFTLFEKTFMVSASSSFGRTINSVRRTGSYVDMVEKISSSPARFSMGLQCSLNDCFKLDLGCSINPVYGLTDVINTTTYFTNQNIMVVSHCGYRYMPRIAGGIGVTYNL